MRLKVLCVSVSCEGKSESFYRKSSPRLRLQANLSAQRRSLWNVLQPDKYKVQWQRCRGGQDKSFFQVLSFFFLRQRFTCWQDFCMHDSNWGIQPTLHFPARPRLVPRPCTPLHVCPLCSPFICLVRILFGLLSSATFQLSFALSARWCGSVNATCHCTERRQRGAKEGKGGAALLASSVF